MLEINPDDATPPYKPQTTGLRLKNASIIALDEFLCGAYGKQQKENTWKF